MSDKYAAAVSYLEQAQTANGSFAGYASPSVDPFRMSVAHPSTFMTSLILAAIRTVPGAAGIRRKAAAFLWEQQSGSGSWNYWQRESSQARTHPYPDDLDDTACALIALTYVDRRAVGGKELGRLASLLIAAETSVGGPYRTWLVPETAEAAWKDVDIAVNANIGRLLALHDTSVPGLAAFIDSALEHGTLTSPYYVGELPTIYFLSFWYRGSQLGRLHSHLTAHLAHYQQLNSVELALAITAARNLGVTGKNRRLARARLETLVEGDRWPAEAMYVDPAIAGTQHYAGSEALTTALALEALMGTSPRKAAPQRATPRRGKKQPVVAAALGRCAELRGDLRTETERILTAMVEADHDGQITDIATLVAAAYGRTIPPQTALRLNLGSLFGWTAYTIYDDFLDGAGKPLQLGSAHWALRQMVGQFGAVSEAASILNRTDEANAWEVRHARGSYQGKKLYFTLPDYGDYRQLAERSWGHTLAPLGVLNALCYDSASQETERLLEFFHHYLIARQLNDDAHDWQADLADGHLTSAVTLLLRAGRATSGFTPSNRRPELGELYWSVVIPQLTELIQLHARAARRALSQCDMQQPEIFAAWLKPLEQGSQAALRKSSEARKFISTFGQGGAAA